MYLKLYVFTQKTRYVTFISPLISYLQTKLITPDYVPFIIIQLLRQTISHIFHRNNRVYIFKTYICIYVNAYCSILKLFENKAVTLLSSRMSCVYTLLRGMKNVKRSTLILNVEREQIVKNKSQIINKIQCSKRLFVWSSSCYVHLSLEYSIQM